MYSFREIVFGEIIFNKPFDKKIVPIVKVYCCKAVLNVNFDKSEISHIFFISIQDLEQQRNSRGFCSTGVLAGRHHLSGEIINQGSSIKCVDVINPRKGQLPGKGIYHAGDVIYQMMSSTR